MVASDFAIIAAPEMHAYANGRAEIGCSIFRENFLPDFGNSDNIENSGVDVGEIPVILIVPF